MMPWVLFGRRYTCILYIWLYCKWVCIHMAGHELGPNTMAAIDSRPPVSAVARQSSVRRWTASRSPDLCTTDQPPRRTVEGKPQRKIGRPGKTRRWWGTAAGWLGRIACITWLFNSSVCVFSGVCVHKNWTYRSDFLQICYLSLLRIRNNTWLLLSSLLSREFFCYPFLNLKTRNPVLFRDIIV